MMDEHVVALVDRVYAAALQPERWQGFIDALSVELGGCGVVLALQMPGQGMPVRAYFTALDPKLGRVLEKRYLKGLPWAPGAMRTLRAGFTPMDELLEVEELARSDFANEWLAPQGLRSSGGLGHCFASAQRVPTAAMVILERDDGPALGAADRALCDLLAPHLANAYALHHRIGDERHGRRALAETMNRLPVGIVLLDRALRPVFTNRTADDILALEDGFALGPDGLRAANDRDDAVLRQLFDDILEGRRAAEHGETVLAVSRPSGKRAFPVLVGRLHEAGKGGGMEDAILSVIFGVPESGLGLSVDALRAAYDLTPVEAELVGLLADGMCLEAVARERGVSLNTVRTQIKHVFAKTDTNRQGELIRLVLTGAASFRQREG